MLRLATPKAMPAAEGAYFRDPWERALAMESISGTPGRLDNWFSI